MIVEDNGAYYIVRSVFIDDIIGPFDNEEDAEKWLRENITNENQD